MKDFEEHLYKLNEEKKQQILAHNEAIIYNIIAGIRYHFLADHGPKYHEVSTKTSIITRYFISMHFLLLTSAFKGFLGEWGPFLILEVDGQT